MPRTKAFLLVLLTVLTIVFGEAVLLPLGIFSAYLLYRLLPAEYNPLLRFLALFPLWTVIASTGALMLLVFPAVQNQHGLLVVTLLLLILNRDVRTRSSSFVTQDVVAFFIVIASFAIHLPSILSFHVGTHLPIPSRGEDVISHLAIYLHMLSEKGLLFFRYHLLDRELSGLLHYPQLFHYGTALVAGALQSANIAEGLPRSIDLFVISFLWWSSVLSAFVFYGSTLQTHFKQPISLAIIGILTALVVSGWIGIYLTFFSFYSQIAALTLFLLSLMLLGTKTRRSWIFAFVAEVGIASTWFFLTPVSTGVLCIESIRNRSMFSKRDWFLLWGLSTFVKGVSIGCSLSGIDTHNALVQPGGILLPPIAVFWCVGIGGVGASLYALWKKNGEQAPFIVALLLSITFSTVLYCYQMWTVGELSYYFYKSLYTIFYTGIVLVFWMYNTCAHSVIVQSHARSNYILGAVTVVLFSFVYFGSREHYRNYTQDRVHFIRPAMYKELLKLSQYPEIGHTEVFFVTDNHIEAYLQERLIPKISGAFFPIERHSLPLKVMQSGEGYLSWLAQEVVRRHQKVILFDPKKRLRNTCAKEFFKLQEKKKLLIFPREGAAWRSDKCGLLEHVR